MEINKHKLTLAAALSVSLVLAACGGSSSGTDGPVIGDEGLIDLGNNPGSGTLPTEASTSPDVNDNEPSFDCGNDFDSATDPDSSTALWSDNCTLRDGGAFANSAYTVGVQRILFCAGFSDGQLESTFVDGVYGPSTEEAVRQYQAERIDSSLSPDGIVGPQTWAAFNTELEEVGVTANDFAVFRVQGGACPEVQFYQKLIRDGDRFIGAGWSMALRPDSTQRTTFSTARPNPGSL